MKKTLTLLLTVISTILAFSQPNDPWKSVTVDGFGNFSNNQSISSLKAFNGKIYAGTGGTSAGCVAKLYSSSSGKPGTWSPVLVSGANNNLFTTMCVYGGTLFIGGKTATSMGKVYMTSNGTNFKSFFDVDTDVSTIFSFKGSSAADSIFIGRSNGPGDELYKADPNTNDSSGIIPGSFRLVKSFPGEVITTSKSVNIGGVDILFVATRGKTSYYTYLYKSTDGISFTKIGGSHIDDVSNTAFAGGQYGYTGISSICQVGNNIYFGTKGNQIVSTDLFYSTNSGNNWVTTVGFPGFDETPCMNNFNNEFWYALADHWGGTNKIQINRGAIGGNNSYSNGNMGHPSNYGINGCMEYFKNNIYYGFENTSIGAQLHRLSTFTVNPTINSSLSICEGDTIKLNAHPKNGAAPITYKWTIKGVVYTVTDSIYNHVTVNNGNTSISLVAIDSNNDTATATISQNVSVTKSTAVFVYVNSSIGPITSGNVVIYKDTSKIAGNYMLDTAAIQSVNSNGLYSFPILLAGKYWIKIFPDTTIAGGFSSIIPTYYGDQFQWDSIKTSGMVVHSCAGIDTFTINAIRRLPIPPGNHLGRIRGRVVEGVNFQKSPGEPIPGADVKVGRKPPGGNIMFSGITDTTGWYDISNIPYNNPGEKYVVYVDIPGYGLSSAYEITIDSLNSQYLQLNYYVDSTTIWPDSTVWTNINNTEIKQLEHLKIYPNPSNGNVIINYSLNSNAQTSISLYNIMGIKMDEFLNKDQTSGNHILQINNENKYPPGVYFIMLVVEGKSIINKILITK